MKCCEELRWKKFPVGSDGFVCLVDVMGDDAAIVQAARVSYGKDVLNDHEAMTTMLIKLFGKDGGESPYVSQDNVADYTPEQRETARQEIVKDGRHLIRYLMRHRHTTPFEMCFHGDTRIPTMSCNGATQKWYTIKQLADGWKKGGKSSSGLKLIKIRAVDLQTGELVPARIKRVWKTGRKKVYRITESSPLQRQILVTDNHPLLTKEGDDFVFRTPVEIGIGGVVMLNGSRTKDCIDKIVEYRLAGMGLEDIAKTLGIGMFQVCDALRKAKLTGKGIYKKRKGGARKIIGTHLDPRAHARHVIPNLADYKCCICGKPATERHHLDENPHNNALENVLPLCVVCHNAFHYDSSPKYLYQSTIKSIEYVGVEDVYDLEIDHPDHCFIADHFAVHNCEVKLLVRVPMDTWRQWIRHRTANVNEYSTRYAEAIDSAAATKPDEWRLQSGSNKQGSDGFIVAHSDAEPKKVPDGCDLTNEESDFQAHARAVYEGRIKAGVAREQARKDLPLSTYTEAYWKCDLHNILHFLALRMDSHAQKEIRDYATIIGQEIIRPLFPIVWEAFEDYRLGSMNLSRLDQIAARFMMRPHSDSERQFQSACETDNSLSMNGWNKDKCRERDECKAKLERLGLL